VKLKEITLEITDQPVSRGIVEKLPWLKTVGRGYLDGRSMNSRPELANMLDAGNFATGDF
jgi:hypothetical protein